MANATANNISTVEAANKSLVNTFISELWNNGNLEAADIYLDPSYVEHSSIPDELEAGGKKAGPAAMKKFVRMFRNAFPDIKFSVVQMIAEGDKVAVQVRGIGTHQGELMGLKPTGKTVVITGAAIHRIVDGKIMETDEFVDKMGLRMQLGAPNMGIMKA